MNRDRRLNHIYLDWAPESFKYSRPKQKIEKPPFVRPDPDRHGPVLSNQLRSLRAYFAKLKAARKAANLASVRETYISVDFNPQGVTKVESLEDKKQDVQVALVRKEAETETKATAVLRLGQGELKALERKVQDYSDPSKLTSKENRRNEDLLGGVIRFRNVGLTDLWTSDPALLADPAQELYWEIWLTRGVKLEWFEKAAKRYGLTIFTHKPLEFPDRVVVMGYGTTRVMEKAIAQLGHIMELRQPSLVKDFVNLDPVEQLDWIKHLRVVTPTEGACPVCLLDDGIDHDHPLLKEVVIHEHVLTYLRAWGTSDRRQGHGTNMAGIVVFGDELDESLAGSREYKAPCQIESVKILPDATGQSRDRLYGEVTQSAIAAVETMKPRDRVFCMAVTADPSPDGAPSAWSAAVDQSCFGSEAPDAPKRMLVVSAGNARWDDATYIYPDSNLTEPVQDPAQAWNPLVVGAYTDFEIHDVDDYPGWDPVAPAGKLSPSTTTSALWSKTWPNRPDVVLEGGNFLSDGSMNERPDCMSLLTTRRRQHPGDRLLTSFGETSCATALAARLCSQVTSEHPGLWPETVRALVVHSARWTPEMMEEVSSLKGRQPIRTLVRTVGMGVPTAARALYSAKDSVTLILEHTIRPFTDNGKLNELHLHELPWPRDILEELDATQVQMRVTLSYFVDPRPGRRDFKSKYNYASHGLRFFVQTNLETKSQFLARINEKARGEKIQKSKSDVDEWLIGPETRDRGSIHSDIWRGTAQALADKEYLAVVPVKGWWADDPVRRELEIRYSLIISIETAEVDNEVDLYSEISAMVQSEVETPLDAFGWPVDEE